MFVTMVRFVGVGLGLLSLFFCRFYFLFVVVFLAFVFPWFCGSEFGVSAFFKKKLSFFFYFYFGAYIRNIGLA